MSMAETSADQLNYLACGLRRGNSALHTSNVPKKLVLHVTVACSLNGAVEAACKKDRIHLNKKLLCIVPCK